MARMDSFERWSTSTFEPAVSEVHSWVGRLRDGYDISVPGSVAGPGTVTTWLFQEQRELFHGSCGLMRVAETVAEPQVRFSTNLRKCQEIQNFFGRESEHLP